MGDMLFADAGPRRPSLVQKQASVWIEDNLVTDAELLCCGLLVVISLRRNLNISLHMEGTVGWEPRYDQEQLSLA